jgi:hypothetical protein
LLKVALKHQKSINPKVQTYFNRCHWIIIHNCISLFIVYVKKRFFFNNFSSTFLLSSLNICIEYNFEIDYIAS